MHMNNFAFVLGLANSIAPATAFFRMSCPGRLVRERLDPIVNPGAVSGHVHTISGGSSFGPEMTYQDARAAKCTSCQIKEDLSNYWTPQLYVKHKNGTFSPVPVVGDGSDTNGGMTVYYLQRGDSGEQLKAFPEGFRMLAGDPFKRNFTGGLDAKAISFACLGQDKAETNNLPSYNCPGGIRAQVFFPSCWNGKDLDTTDHKSHMSYPSGQNYNNGPCPSDFPVHLISLFYEVLYDTNPFLSEWDGNQHPFVFAQGDGSGYGFHGDFVNGWDITVLQKAVDTCTADSGRVEDCGAVSMYTSAECNACKLPTVVDEPTDGALAKLPGCNDVTYGPDYAKPASNCPTTPLSAPAANYVDLTTSKKWEYTGCGTDSLGSRALKGKSTASDDMTVEKCVDFCSGAGFSHAGLEYGRECYCDNSVPDANAPKDGIMGGCTMKCAGNNTEFCGNAAQLSIYHKCGDTCKNNQIGGSSGSGSGSSSSAPSVASTAPASSKATGSSSAVSVSAAAIATTTSASAKDAITTTATSAAASNPSTTKAATVASTTSVTPTKIPSCPHYNCINQIFNPTASASATAFCATYTQTVNTDDSALPTYMNNCRGHDDMSSACSCLAYPTAYANAKRDHARMF